MKWTRLPDLTVARYDHGSACVGDVVYVIGGKACKDDTEDIRYRSSVERLEKMKKWRVMYRMPEPLSACAAVHINGNIFICGGECDGGSEVNSFLAYNIAAQTWSDLQSLPYVGVNLLTVTLGNTLYIVDPYGVEGRWCISYTDGSWELHAAHRQSWKGG